MPPNNLSLDIETFSSEDLQKAGVYRYAESPDFRLLLLGYSLDGQPVEVIDLASGEVLPPLLLSALLSPDVEKWAFNAAFERVCLSRYLRDLGLLPPGRRWLPPGSWRCSMIWSSYLGLPMSLAGVGAALNLDRQKLTEGKDLIRFFCRPAKPTLLNGQGNRNLPSTDPERWQRFRSYNLRDVEVEMEIRKRLAKHPVPEPVWREYAMDQEINDRGIRVDREFVSAALAMDSLSRSELTAELSRLTNIDNPNSPAQPRILDQQAQSLLDQISSLRALSTQVSAAFGVNLSSGTRTVTAIRDSVVHLMEAEETLNRKIDELVDKKAEISRTIDQVPDPFLRLIPEKRYLTFFSWDRIAADLAITPRWAQIRHGEALRAVEEILEKQA